MRFFFYISPFALSSFRIYFLFLLHFPCFIRRRQWHPTPVLLRGKSYGRRSLVGWVHEVVKSRTWLSDFTFNFHFHALEKEMATHSSVLAWRIPRTGEPGGLPSMGSHRVGHNWGDLAAAAAAEWISRKWISQVGIVIMITRRSHQAKL